MYKFALAIKYISAGSGKSSLQTDTRSEQRWESRWDGGNLEENGAGIGEQWPLRDDNEWE